MLLWVSCTVSFPFSLQFCDVSRCSSSSIAFHCPQPFLVLSSPPPSLPSSDSWPLCLSGFLCLSPLHCPLFVLLSSLSCFSNLFALMYICLCLSLSPFLSPGLLLYLLQAQLPAAPKAKHFRGRVPEPPNSTSTPTRLIPLPPSVPEPWATRRVPVLRAFVLCGTVCTCRAGGRGGRLRNILNPQRSRRHLHPQAQLVWGLRLWGHKDTRGGTRVTQNFGSLP